MFCVFLSFVFHFESFILSASTKNDLSLNSSAFLFEMLCWTRKFCSTQIMDEMVFLSASNAHSFQICTSEKKKTKLWNVIRIAQITQTVNKIVFIVVLYTLFCGEEKLKWWIFFSKVEKPKIFSDINKMWCFSVMHMNFARSRVAFWNKNIKESPDRCQNRMIEHKTEKFFFFDNLLLKLSNKDTDTELCEMEMTEMYDNDLQIRSNL